MSSHILIVTAPIHSNTHGFATAPAQVIPLLHDRGARIDRRTSTGTCHGPLPLVREASGGTGLPSVRLERRWQAAGCGGERCRSVEARDDSLRDDVYARECSLQRAEAPIRCQASELCGRQMCLLHAQQFCSQDEGFVGVAREGGSGLWCDLTGLSQPVPANAPTWLTACRWRWRC